MDSEFYKNSFEKIRLFKPKIKDSSIHSYLRMIKKISKDLFNSDIPSLSYFASFNQVKEYTLTFSKSVASKKNLITSIIVLLKSYLPENNKQDDLVKLYEHYHKELSSTQEDAYLDNVKTLREETNWITGKDISDKIKFLENECKGILDRKHLDNIQRVLVLCLYTMIPPLRNDYVLVKVVSGVPQEDSCIDISFNYIDLSTNKLLLCNYKTDKYYGIKKIDLPGNLMNLVIKWESAKREYFKERLSHNFLLLNTTNGINMKHNTLTKYINRIFHPKKVSTTLLRKIYLSEKYPVTNTFRQMQHDSFVMGHNIETARKVYSKK